MVMDFLLTVAQPNCSQVVVPPPPPEAISYYYSQSILWILNHVWGLLVCFLFLFSGASGKLARFSWEKGRSWFFSTEIYVGLFITLYYLLQFPLSLYNDYIQPHTYGLSNQSFFDFCIQECKYFLIFLIGSLCFVWMFYAALKRSRYRWWIYGSLVAMILQFLGTFIYPLWIAPLFNQFKPMQNTVLEKQVLDLVAPFGIDKKDIFEVDKSKETKMINAYVAGFAGSKRIVIWDTAIQQMPPSQLLFVVAHEMGHYVLSHIWWHFIWSIFFILILFYLIYKTANQVLKRFSMRFQFNNLSSIGSLPLFLLLLQCYTIVFLPFNNGVSRYFEHQADRFALEVTHDNEAAGHAFLTLQQGNLANPYPGFLYRMFRGSHPSLGERVDFCNQYCPWKKGSLPNQEFKENQKSS